MPDPSGRFHHGNCGNRMHDRWQSNTKSRGRWPRIAAPPRLRACLHPFHPVAPLPRIIGHLMFRERHEGEVLKMGEVFPRISANGELAQIFYTLIAKNLNQRLQRVQGVKGSRVQTRLRRWFNRPYGLVQGFGRSSLVREFESSKAGERRVYLLLITCHLLPDSLLTLLLASVQRHHGAAGSYLKIANKRVSCQTPYPEERS